jgi:hypothetical protein
MCVDNVDFRLIIVYKNKNKFTSQTHSFCGTGVFLAAAVGNKYLRVQA